MGTSTGGDGSGVLAGVRVVEFAQNAAVPQCGRLLAGMGADVVKVEPPEGDAMRHLAAVTPTESRAFASINPGKRAIVVDLTSPGAAPVVAALAGWADVVLVGLKATDVARYGLDWDRLSEINPRLVELVFTAYGALGPDREKGGYDPLVQAVSGVGWHMNRTEGGVPRPSRPAIIDFASGAMATAAVLGALRHRDLHGEGQCVDASLLGTAMSLGTPLLTSFETDAERMRELEQDLDALRTAGVGFEVVRAHHESQIRAGGGLFDVYVRAYETADGVVSVAGYSPALIARFHQITGIEQPPAEAVSSGVGLEATIQAAEELFRSRTTSTWIAELGAVGYPCARYHDPQQAIRTEQVEANGYVVDLDHEVVGRYRTVGMPFGYSSSETAVTVPSPRLGQHTASVLAEIGFDEGEIAELLSASVVLQAG